MSVKFIVSDQLFNAVLGKVAERPYAEVGELIKAIEQDVKINSQALAIVLKENLVPKPEATITPPKIEEVRKD